MKKAQKDDIERRLERVGLPRSDSKSHNRTWPTLTLRKNGIACCQKYLALRSADRVELCDGAQCLPTAAKQIVISWPFRLGVRTPSIRCPPLLVSVTAGRHHTRTFGFKVQKQSSSATQARTSWRHHHLTRICPSPEAGLGRLLFWNSH